MRKLSPVIIMVLGGFVIFQSLFISHLNTSLNEYEEMNKGYQTMTQEAQDRTEEALDMTDDWKEAYIKLQEEHSQAVEYIEQLEYEVEMFMNEN